MTYRFFTHSFSLFIILLLGILASGCSRVAIYDDKKLKSENKTGIKFYAPKPYVLVSRTGNSTNPVSVEVIYLPDLANEYYARPISGLGASKLSMTFSNGVLTTFGQENDPKINELISAIGGVPGLLATAEKTRRESDQIGVQTGLLVNQSSELPSSAIKLENTVKDLMKLGDSIAYPGLTTDQIATIGISAKKLKVISEEMKRPGASTDEILDKIKQEYKILQGVKQISSDIPENEKATWRLLNQSKKETQGIITKLSPKQPEKPTLTMYEIKIDDNGTHLIEVPFDKQSEILNVQ